ncbi:hypothetical protein [Microvirga subterranea]|uniref:Uncharacterized protein n=1 Tax=Microvirga subterranea TaxID=186651 RepID=A0A370HMW2_9HYPH|nr:hypothetical protein [Microvirga subterranea]RDI59916.1 hypothetical protein DES45_103172 [Microvirga subterranea]
MAAPTHDHQTPGWKDIQSMLTPIGIGAAIAILLLLIYSFVRFA